MELAARFIESRAAPISDYTKGSSCLMLESESRVTTGAIRARDGCGSSREQSRQRFGYLEIVSPLVLTDLPAAPLDSQALTRIHLQVRYQSATAIEEVFCWPGRYGLKLSKCAAGWLMTSRECGEVSISDDGQELCWHIPGLEPDAAVTDFLVRRVLPRIALLHQGTVMHGAAVSNGRHALLLLGASGAGKSTLCAALCRAGWQALSDDLSILRDDDGPTVWPGAAGVCLWADARTALTLTADQSRPLPSYHDKHWFALEQPLQKPAYPLQACVMLSRSAAANSVTLERVSALEGVRELTSQLIRFNPADRDATIELLMRLNSLLRSTPVYRLTYPDRFSALPRTVERLVQAFP